MPRIHSEEKYTIVEKTDWSWRYDVDSVSLENATRTNAITSDELAFALTDTSKAVQVTFDNERKTPAYWLSGDSYCENWWGAMNGSKLKNLKELN